VSSISTPPLPSNRSFGSFFSAVLAVGSAYFYWKQVGDWALALVLLAALFASATLLAPDWLAPLNRLWHELGLLLGKIFNPLILGALFFGVITPVSLATRLFGRDVLRLRKRSVASYWIDRDPGSPPPESFRNQF
jgi:hypothetical protein